MTARVASTQALSSASSLHWKSERIHKWALKLDCECICTGKFSENVEQTGSLGLRKLSLLSLARWEAFVGPNEA